MSTITNPDIEVAAFSAFPAQATPAPSPASPDIALVTKLLSRLARALGNYGGSANHVEGALASCAAALGVEAEFFATPTSVIVTVGPEGDQRTMMTPIRSSDVDLEKLVHLDRLLMDIAHHRAGPEEALARIREIEAMPGGCRFAGEVSAFALTAGIVAILFSAAWIDVIASAFVGAIVGLLTASAHGGAIRLAEFLAGATAALLGAGCAHLLGASAATVTLAGVIVLVPGFTLTIAMNELATRHLVSGAARLMGASLIFIMIGFGVAVGQRTAEAVGLTQQQAAGALAQTPPEWLLTPALAIIAFPLVVLFRVARRDWIWVLLAALIGFLGARLGALAIGPVLGAGVGALFVAIVGNATARLLNRPAAVMNAPGLLLLLPGSLGYRSIDALLHDQVAAGVETAFNMIMVAASLVTGLLIAALLVPPRRDL